MRHTYFFLTIVFITCTLLPNDSLAQSCLPDGITFTTQQQIEDFATDYPGCTEIIGNVVIGHLDGVIFTDITSLSGLSQLTSVNRLSISKNNALTNLEGLENITSINGGSLYIWNNNALTNLSDLGSLNFIYGILSIRANNVLSSLAGLENLTSVSGLEIWENHMLSNLTNLNNINTIGTLTIEDNNSLTSLAGLENLTTIGNFVTISKNNTLSNLSGLDKLSSVGGSLTISQNNTLLNLSGLESLTSVNGYLTIEENTSLITLEHLSNLSSIDGYINIYSNDVLTRLMGLENIDYTTISELYIDTNPNLSICGFPNICAVLNAVPMHYISSNATGCSSEAEILSTCTVSVNEPELSLQAPVTPNPNKGVFQISGITKGDYVIFNTTGQILQSGQLTTDLTIDIADAPQGIYFIEIRDGEQAATQRFIKQ